MKLEELVTGVYTDADENDALHIDLPTFLKAHGYADTPENRAMIIQMWQEAMAQKGIIVQVLE